MSVLVLLITNSFKELYIADQIFVSVNSSTGSTASSS